MFQIVSGLDINEMFSKEDIHLILIIKKGIFLQRIRKKIKREWRFLYVIYGELTKYLYKWQVKINCKI